MEVLYPRCLGLGVHKRQVTATLRVAEGSKVRKERREYGTDTASLFELRDWLEYEGVTHVAMEAAGTYWKPVWHALEGAFELEAMLACVEVLERPLPFAGGPVRILDSRPSPLGLRPRVSARFVGTPNRPSLAVPSMKNGALSVPSKTRSGASHCRLAPPPRLPGATSP